MCSLHTTKTDSSRAVKTRKLLILQFGEKSVFPYISLLDIVAIYNLTTHARLPFCPKFLLMQSIYPTKQARQLLCFSSALAQTLHVRP